LGYIDNCDGNGICHAHLGRVNGSYCSAILARLKKEQKQADDLLKTQAAACAASPQDARCVSAAADYQGASTTIQQLAAQYQICRTAAMLGPSVVTAPPSSP
jgi:hypothetical protein